MKNNWVSLENEVPIKFNQYTTQNPPGFTPRDSHLFGKGLSLGPVIGTARHGGTKGLINCWTMSHVIVY